MKECVLGYVWKTISIIFTVLDNFLIVAIKTTTVNFEKLLLIVFFKTQKTT